MPVLAAVLGAALLGRFASLDSTDSRELEVAVASESASPTPRARPRPSRSPRPSPTPRPSPPGAWTELEPEPLQARFSATTLWTGTALVVWGGHLSQWPERNEIAGDGAMWSQREQSWTKIPPAPMPVRQSSAVAWTGDELFVWGGSDAAGHRADGALYDPVRGWSTLPAGPLSPRHGAVAIRNQDEVFVLGGWDNLGALNDAAAYNLRTRQWRPLPSLPPQFGETLRATRTGPATVIVWAQNSYGGPGPPPPLRYDARRDRWRPVAPRSSVTAEGMGSIVAVRDDLYALSSSSPAVFRLRAGSKEWEPLLTLDDEGAWAQHLLAAGRYVFVVSTNPTLAAYRLDTRTTKWVALPRDTAPWQEMTAAWTGDELLVRGIVGNIAGADGDIAPRLQRWRPTSERDRRRLRRSPRHVEGRRFDLPAQRPRPPVQGDGAPR